MAKRKRQPRAVLKLLITGGQANPAPPLGPALSQHRVNIGQFISQFNEKTKSQMGVPLSTVVQVYHDGSFDFEIRSPLTSYLLKRAAEVAKGSGLTGREPAGAVTRAQVMEIARQKMADLNTRSLEAAVKIVEGTARSCGIEIKD
jgi:large subunit ribosomal protein L11